MGSGDNSGCQGPSISTLTKPRPGAAGSQLCRPGGQRPASWAGGRERGETKRQALVVGGALSSGGGRFIRAGPLLAPPCRGACHRPGATITLCHSTAAWLNPTEVGSHRRGPGSGSAGLRSFQKRRAGPACLSARWPRPPRHPLACGCIALISASRPVSSHRRLPCGHLCPHSFANLATSHVGSAPTLVTSSSLGYMCKHPVSA